MRAKRQKPEARKVARISLIPVRLTRTRWLSTAIAVVCAAMPLEAAMAQDNPDLAPYVMVRSLQFVQDSVVLGDHSAAEMQRFMLSTIDRRLREAQPSVFADPRNVDAAMIYAMSGGNPATLEYLASRDIEGHFDNRVADGLRKYLGGKGVLVAKGMADMADEYRDQRIGPYLALVSGNIAVVKDVKAALGFYDWARLTAPGTIIEEAALRRSVAITIDAGMSLEALSYSRQYARRFIHSPYAGQFADLFVQLVVGNAGKIGEEDIDGTLEFVAADRRREIFLRIARAAAIAGKNDLARMASVKAEAIGGNPMPEALARLYGGVASIPTGSVTAALDVLGNIPEDALSPRDRALRNAAAAVARQVLTQPGPDSLRQDGRGSMAAAVNAPSPGQSPGPDVAAPVAAPPVNPAGATPAKFDPAFQTFVDRGRSRLTAIDDLLKQEGASR